MGVVLASKGYPGSYEKGFPIQGLPQDGTIVYHMGTKCESGVLKTAGGRVLMCINRGSSLADAAARTYAAVRGIDCPALFYRSDIGHWELNK